MAGHNGNGGQASAAELGQVAFRGHGGRRPRVLAHGSSRISERSLAQDEQYLYFTDAVEGTLTRLPKDGGIPFEIVSDQRGICGLVLHGAHLYWVTKRATYPGGKFTPDGLVCRMPAGGGDIEIIAGGQDLPSGVAVAGDTVVWTNFGDGTATGTVCAKTLGGDPPVTLATKQKQPKSILVDESNVYWACFGTKHPSYFADGSVMRRPRDGSSKRFAITKDQSLQQSLVMDDSAIYWARGARIWTEPGAPAALLKRKKGRGKVITLASFPHEAAVLALDATHVYWLDRYRSALFRVRKDGGTEPEQLLSGNGEALFTSSLVVDDRCVYWTANDSGKAGGAVWKMAK